MDQQNPRESDFYYIKDDDLESQRILIISALFFLGAPETSVVVPAFLAWSDLDQE